MKRFYIATFVLAAAVAINGCSRNTGQKDGQAGGKGASQSLQVKGSDTMVNLGQAWAEAFMKKEPSVSVAVVGGGSGTGIAALLSKKTDVAQCSRAMKAEELEQAKKNGVEPVETIVGYDGIAVVVNPANSVSKLTITQLADIFDGHSTNWKDFGGKDAPIVVLSREVNSGTHVYFKEHVLNGGDSKGTVEFTDKALLMPSSQAIADEVASNPNAIGYYGMGYISDKQKVVEVAKDSSAAPVAPTAENVIAKTYPISRPLYVYTDGKPAGLTKEYVDFLLSADGQKIVKKLDFVPVK